MPPTTPSRPSLGLTFSQAGTALSARARAALAAQPAWRFHLLAAAFALGAAVLFHAPKLWLMRHPVPGSFEWDRALTFLAQCRDPFGGALEPAMRWRILPPLVAHTLGLTGTSALLLPLLGVAVLLVTWSTVSLRWLGDRLDTLVLASIAATSGALLTPLHWLGVNDGWYLLGLVAVAGGRSTASLVLPGLLAPWVDERFLFGLPLAVCSRLWLQGPDREWRRVVMVAAAAVVPYLAIRGGWTLFFGDPTSRGFLRDGLAQVPRYLSFGWIGWWNGYRAGWLLCVAAAIGAWLSGGRRGLVAGLGSFLLGMTAITALAADLSRSTGLALPALLIGAVTLRRAGFTPTTATLILSAVAVFNLVTPVLFVTYTKVIPTWPLPLELFRLLRPVG